MTERLWNILVDSFPKILLPGLKMTIPLTVIAFALAMVIATVVGALAEEPSSPGFIVATALFVAVQLGSAVAFILWIKRHSAAASPAEKEVGSHESAQ